ncbi:MAG TPA: CRTAC1 family protein [Opitutaceae bacterium]|nr:CRTAC1 family protein [Opitutaceae bacterium]
MNPSPPTFSRQPVIGRTAWPGRPTVPPLLPIVLPLVLAAIGLSVALAWLFPAAGSLRPAPAVRFTDVTKEWGVRFVHRGGVQDPPTTLGGAVVVLDYDRDGRPDLFFVNGAPWPWEDASAAPATTCALYHNDGNGHLSDVTRAAGLAIVMQGMAAAAGDFDNDGYPDLFVTGVGRNHLFHNQGSGTFAEVTDSAGVGGDGQTWSTGATWIDIDGDGLLDLVVANYAHWVGDVDLATAFSIALMGHSYGAPTGFVGAFPSVYRNLGHGRFAPVPGSAGMRNIDPQTHLPVAKALAVVPLDANGDGKLDLLFSYHTAGSALFLNQGDGTFRQWATGAGQRNEGASAGLASASTPAYPPSADAQAILSALESAQRSERRGRSEPEVHLGGKLGVAPLDYDLAGRLDFFSGNGHAEPDVNRFEAGRDFAAVPQLWWNRGDTWIPAAAPGAAGGAWARAVVARGVAVADLDGDGDSDVIIAQNNGPAIVLRNDERSGLPWLRVALIATRSQPGAGGARVEVHTPGRALVRTMAPAMGFMAQSESMLTFGLGDDARVREIVIHWPSGQRQVVHPDSVNRTLTIREP